MQDVERSRLERVADAYRKAQNHPDMEWFASKDRCWVCDKPTHWVDLAMGVRQHPSCDSEPTDEDCKYILQTIGCVTHHIKFYPIVAVFAEQGDPDLETSTQFVCTSCDIVVGARHDGEGVVIDTLCNSCRIETKGL